MSNQAGDAKDDLPFQSQYAFQELYGRLPTDAARLRLWKVKDAFKLDASDPLWGVILALDYHLALYETLPEDIQIASSALKGSLRQALQEFMASKDCLHEDFLILGDRLLRDLVKKLTTSVEWGIGQSTKDLTMNLGLLLRYLQDGDSREELLEPLRLDVKRMAGDFNVEMVSTIHKAGDEAVALVKSAVPAAKREGIFIGMLWVSVVVMIGVNLTLGLVSNYIWNRSAQATVAWQESLQRAFVAGLDKETRALLERHNAHLPADQRLKLQ